MPTILRIRGYRFFFFSLEGEEPPHIHVEHGDKVAKYWLKPATLASSSGFKSSELTEIRKLVEKQSDFFEQKWYEYFRAKI